MIPTVGPQNTSPCVWFCIHQNNRTLVVNHKMWPVQESSTSREKERSCIAWYNLTVWWTYYKVILAQFGLSLSSSYTNWVKVVRITFYGYWENRQHAMFDHLVRGLEGRPGQSWYVALEYLRPMLCSSLKLCLTSSIAPTMRWQSEFFWPFSLEKMTENSSYGPSTQRPEEMWTIFSHRMYTTKLQNTPVDEPQILSSLWVSLEKVIFSCLILTHKFNLGFWRFSHFLENREGELWPDPCQLVWARTSNMLNTIWPSHKDPSF